MPENLAAYRRYFFGFAGMALKAQMKETEMKVAANPRQYLGMNAPSDVANAIIFLLSPASRKITGVQLPVDGGYASC